MFLLIKFLGKSIHHHSSNHCLFPVRITRDVSTALLAAGSA